MVVKQKLTTAEWDRRREKSFTTVGDYGQEVEVFRENPKKKIFFSQFFSEFFIFLEFYNLFKFF